MKAETVCTLFTLFFIALQKLMQYCAVEVCVKCLVVMIQHLIDAADMLFIVQLDGVLSPVQRCHQPSNVRPLRAGTSETCECLAFNIKSFQPRRFPHSTHTGWCYDKCLTDIHNLCQFPAGYGRVVSFYWLQYYVSVAKHKCIVILHPVKTSNICIQQESDILYFYCTFGILFNIDCNQYCT